MAWPRAASPRRAGSPARRRWWWRSRCPAIPRFPECSGVLVASGEQLRAKAITLSSRKWGARGDVQLLRLSFGRFGDDLATTRFRRRAAGLGGGGPGHRVRAGRRPGRCPRAALDRRDAAVRPRPRRSGRRDARRPAADAGRGRQLPRRHRRAGVYRGGRQGGHASSRRSKHKWHDRCHGQARLRRPELDDSLPDVLGVLGAARRARRKRDAVIDERRPFSSSRRSAASWCAASTTSPACGPTPIS